MRATNMRRGVGRLPCVRSLARSIRALSRIARVWWPRPRVTSIPIVCVCVCLCVGELLSTQCLARSSNFETCARVSIIVSARGYIYTGVLELCFSRRLMGLRLGNCFADAIWATRARRPRKPVLYGRIENRLNCGHRRDGL